MIFTRNIKGGTMAFDISEAKIPDLEDMLKVAQRIKEVSLEKTRLGLVIEDTKSKTVIALTTKAEHFVNGKPPSMAFIRETYLFTGLDGQLYEYRKQLGQAEAELEFLKNKLSIYRDMIDVWRTISANKRASVI